MSNDVDKINQISEKISVLIALKNQKQDEIKRLEEENKTLKEERYTLANQNSSLVKEIENLKTFDRTSESGTDKLDEVKINGMIKEIEECLALLKS